MGKKILGENGLPLRSGLYWNGNRIGAKFSIRGRPVYFSTGTDDWWEALKKAEQEKQRLLSEEKAGSGDLVKRVTIDELMQDYLQYLIRKNAERGDYEPATAKIIQYSYNAHMKDEFGNVLASKFGTREIEAYRVKRLREGRSKGRQPHAVACTTDKELGYLRSAMYRAAKSTPKKFEKALVPDFGISKESMQGGARTGTVTDDQFYALLPHLPEHVRVMFAFCMRSGTRKKEARFALRSKVIWEKRLVKLNANETKSRKERIVPIPKDVFPMIWRFEQGTRAHFDHCPYLFHLAGLQITSQNLDDNFKRACLKAGLAKERKDAQGNPVQRRNRQVIIDQEVHWHDTRRTFVTELGAMDGINDTDRGRVAGQTAATIARYDQNASAEKIRDAMDTKRGGNGATTPAPVAPAASVRDWKADLRELKAMLDDGILTAEEFAAEKARVLAERWECNRTFLL